VTLAAEIAAKLLAPINNAAIQAAWLEMLVKAIAEMPDPSARH
jgi:hypothetical protein